MATSDNVTDEVWEKYIEDRKPEEPDDHFKSRKAVVQKDDAHRLEWQSKPSRQGEVRSWEGFAPSDGTRTKSDLPIN